MKTNFNCLKTRVLKILQENGDWLTVPVIARKVALPYSDRGLYPYLRRLARQGLLAEGRNGVGRLFYRITERGIRRLQFLNDRAADRRSGTPWWERR